MIPSPQTMTIHVYHYGAVVVRTDTDHIATFTTGPTITTEVAISFAETFIAALRLQERFEALGGQRFDEYVEALNGPHHTH